MKAASELLRLQTTSRMHCLDLFYLHGQNLHACARKNYSTVEIHLKSSFLSANYANNVHVDVKVDSYRGLTNWSDHGTKRKDGL